MLHWHGDTFDLPAGTTLLASTELSPNQAFSRGPNVLGLQFHPEVLGARFEHWLLGHASELATAGISPVELRSDARRYACALEKAGAAMLAGWLSRLTQYGPSEQDCSTENTVAKGFPIMTRPTPVFPEGRQELYKKNRYSAAIRSGDLLFVSGQVGGREDGSPEPDIAAQIRLAFDNLGSVLTAAGCTFHDVVDVTSFHVDPENHAGLMLAVKDEVFPGPDYPSWTAVGVTWLSGFQFEIKAIARIPAGD